MELPVLNTPSDRSAVDKLRVGALQIEGKIRRYFRSNVYTRDNEKLLTKRKGECTRCGACCKILLRCPFLEEVNGEYSCQIYGQHFKQCQLYPLVPRDLKEIDSECGYYFESE